MRRAARPKGRRVKLLGMTLIEVLMVFGLIGLVMLLVGPVVAPAGRVLQRADVDTRAQQTAVVTIEKIFKDLAYSDPRGLNLKETSPPYLCYPSTNDPGWNGLVPLVAGELDTLQVYTQPVWKKFTLINYDPQSRKLWRRDLVYSGGDQIATVKNSKIGNVLLDASYPKLALASDVKDFTVQSVANGVLRIALTVSQTWDQERTTRLETCITMRN